MLLLLLLLAGKGARVKREVMMYGGPWVRRRRMYCVDVLAAYCSLNRMLGWAGLHECSMSLLGLGQISGVLLD